MARRRQRVLGALQKALSGAVDGRGDGWVCGRTLQHPEVGGQRFAARLHELRQEGVAMERKPCGCHRCAHAIRQARRRGEHPPRYMAWRLVDREVVGHG